MEILNLEVDKLISYAKNTKKHPKEQIKKIANSIKEFGFNVPVIVDKNNVLVAGHGRVMAAQYLKMTHVPGIKKDDLSEAQIKAYRIADNKTAESEWDFDFLKDEFKDLMALDYDLDLTGFSEDEIGDLTDEEEIEEAPLDVPNEIKTDIKIGDIFQLGEHRLMCGDSTSKEAVHLLMDGAKADMVFTDPPYGIDKDIMNDNLKGKEFSDWNEKWIKNLPEKGGFVCYHSTRTFPLFLIPALKCGWKFERMLWFHRPDKFPVHTWNSWMLTSQSILLLSKGEVKYNKVSPANQDYYRCTSSDLTEKSGHPTEKIVSHCVEVMKHYDFNIVLDLFGGTGSTLIAAEQTKRKCYMMELDPKYCQVIINRWEKLVDQKVHKIK